MNKLRRSMSVQITGLFVLLSGVGALLFLAGAWRNQAWTHWFLLWNLVLAWIPFLLALALRWSLKRWRWSQWRPLVLTATWFMFLPNTFYMVTDFIHLYDTPRVDLVYDTVMFSMVVGTALMLGLISMVVVQGQLRRRLPPRSTWRIVVAILLVASAAIYVGRYLRWNTWDIFIHPVGMLFDLSELFLRPFAYPQLYWTTGAFFVALLSVYYCLWRLADLLDQTRS